MGDIRRYKQIIAIAIGIHIAILFAMFSGSLFRFEFPIPTQILAVLLAFPAGLVCGWLAKDLDLKSAEMVDCIITYIIAIVIINLIVFFVANLIGEIMLTKEVELNISKIVKIITDTAWSAIKPEFISEMLSFIFLFYGYWFYLRMEEARKTPY